MTMFNFDQVILDLDGKPLKAEMDKELLLGDMCVNALVVAVVPGDEISGPEKRLRVRLAERIKKATADGLEIYVSPKDISRLLAVIGKAYVTLPAARALELLDPGGVPIEDEEEPAS